MLKKRREFIYVLNYNKDNLVKYDLTRKIRRIVIELKTEDNKVHEVVRFTNENGYNNTVSLNYDMELLLLDIKKSGQQCEVANEIKEGEIFAYLISSDCPIRKSEYRGTYSGFYFYKG